MPVAPALMLDPAALTHTISPVAALQRIPSRFQLWSTGVEASHQIDSCVERGPVAPPILMPERTFRLRQTSAAPSGRHAAEASGSRKPGAELGPEA